LKYAVGELVSYQTINFKLIFYEGIIKKEGKEGKKDKV
jgi:hypothetical protein